MSIGDLNITVQYKKCYGWCWCRFLEPIYSSYNVGVIFYGSATNICAYISQADKLTPSLRDV